jgi:hypothetical protein
MGTCEQDKFKSILKTKSSVQVDYQEGVEVKKYESRFNLLIGTIIFAVLMYFFFWVIVSEIIGINFGDMEGIVTFPIFLAVSYFAQKRFPNIFQYLRRGNESELQEFPRDEIISLPIFPGSVDREKGIVQGTARNVTNENLSHPTAKAQEVNIINIVRIRVELLDDEGNHVDYIPVEIKGASTEWVGTVEDGDRIRVQGGFLPDGILHSSKGFNYTTNSYFGVTG